MAMRSPGARTADVDDEGYWSIFLRKFKDRELRGVQLASQIAIKICVCVRLSQNSLQEDLDIRWKLKQRAATPP